MQFGEFLGHLHYIFTLMGCGGGGVTHLSDNPPSDAYGCITITVSFEFDKFLLTIF